MINKIKKFSQIFKVDKKNKTTTSLKDSLKPIVFVKYIIIASISFSTIFLLTPKIFDYQKKVVYLEKNLLKEYNIQVKNYSTIKYKIFPKPHLDIFNSELEINNSIVGRNSNIKIFLNLRQFYNFQNININKIAIKNSNLFLEFKDMEEFVKYIKNVKSEIYIKNSNRQLIDNKVKLINLNHITFNNRNKNNLLFKGKFLNKKFILNFKNKNNDKKAIFRFPEIGLRSEVNFNEASNSDRLKGKMKLEILKNKFKFSFKKDKNFKIFDSYFKNSIVQTSYDGTVNFNPYFYFNFILNSKYLNFSKLLKNIDLSKENLFKVNKKLNGFIKFKLEKNSLTSQLIKSADISLNFKNGEIKLYKSYVNFDEGSIEGNGFYSENEGYKKLKFSLILKIIQSKKILKKIGINYNKNLNNKNLIKLD